MTVNQVLEISRADHGRTRTVTEELTPLPAAAVRLRVDRVAVTANTVTYANAGDLLGYWDFYPAGDPAWGRTPAMGWAEVVESHHPEVAVGGRYYGWYPMAGFVDVTVTPTRTGLRDDGAHRAAHAPVYRALEATDRDPLYPREADPSTIGDLEDRHALLRGLFLTGYLAAAFFRVHDWYSTPDAVVLSASSKTAIAFARSAAEAGAGELIGVTSAGNADFVAGLGVYGRVVTYDDVLTGRHGIDSAVVVDMAGNRPVLAALHAQLGDRIGYSMTIGLTHHDQPRVDVAGGPAPQLFFAPTALQQMGELGADPTEVQMGAATALGRFVEDSVDWLRVERVHGPDAAAATWSEVHAGTLDPAVGRIVSMH